MFTWKYTQRTYFIGIVNYFEQDHKISLQHTAIDAFYAGII